MRILVIAALLITLAGCASNGTPIEQDDVRQIVQGQTTYDQMLERFGNPLSQSFDSKEISKRFGSTSTSDLWHWHGAAEPHCPFRQGKQGQAIRDDQRPTREALRCSSGGAEIGRSWAS
ncbi:hypothetical protein P4161_14635 [Pseudomonas aeruginosa]|nr:hypothetical protein [Pseudomonas aeruginosa]